MTFPAPIENLPTMPTPPNSITRPGSFNTDSDATFAQLPAVIDKFNQNVPKLNAVGANAGVAVAAMEELLGEATGARDDAVSSAAAAAAATHFKGLWSGLEGELVQPATARHMGQNWILVANVEAVEAEEPGVSAAWEPSLPLKTIGGQSLVGTGDVELPDSGISANLFTRTFIAGESASFYLASPVDGAAFVSAQREIPQLGQTTLAWQTNIAPGNFDFEDYGLATTLTPSATSGDVTLALGAGNWPAESIGRRVEGNGGVAIVLSVVGGNATATVLTPFTSTAAIPAGQWHAYGLSVYSGKLRLGTIGGKQWRMDVATLLRDSTSLPNLSASNTSHAFQFSADGMAFFSSGSGSPSTQARRYTLLAPFDLSNYASYADTDLGYAGARFVGDGSALWLQGGSVLIRRTVTVPWTFTGLAAATTFALSATTIGGRSYAPVGSAQFRVREDGTFAGRDVYVLGRCTTSPEDYRVLRYRFAAAWTPETVSATAWSNPIPLDQTITSAAVFCMSGDGSVAYIPSNVSGEVRRLDFTEAWNLASMVIGASVAPGGASVGAVYRLDYARDGRELLLHSASGAGGNKVRQYGIAGAQLPLGVPYVARYKAPIDTEFWTAMRDMAMVYSQGDVYCAFSVDGRQSYQITTRDGGLRTIARLQAGVWQYNSDAVYGVTTWTNAAINHELSAIRQAVGIAANRMTASLMVQGRSWDLSTFNVGTLAATTGNWLNSTYGSSSLVITPDGARYHFIRSSGSLTISPYLYEVTPTTPFSVEGVGTTLKVFTNLASSEAVPMDASYMRMQWSADGLALFVLSRAPGAGGYPRNLYKYATSLAFRISGLDLTTPVQAVALTGVPQLAEMNDASHVANDNFVISADGLNLYVTTMGSYRVHQLSLGAPWSLSPGMAYVGSVAPGEAAMGGPPVYPVGLHITPDGKTLYITRYASGNVAELSLATPHLITTAAFVRNVAVPGGVASSSGRGCVAFSPGGEYFFGWDQPTETTAKLRRLSVPPGGPAPMPEPGETLDLAVAISSSNPLQAAEFGGVGMGYDANVTQEVLMPGTHYTYTQPSDGRVDFKALVAGNYRVRIA